MVIYMKKAKITVKDVAERAGVSATTVSMILNGKKTFPEETSRRVIDACNELGYARGGAFQAEVNDDKVLIAVVPTLANLYFVHAVGAMQRRAKELGYSLVTFETFRERVQEARVIRICKGFPFAGVILFYPLENSAYLQQMEATMPVIHIYDKGVYEQSNSIEFDGLRVGSVIGEHLLELGHERIAFLTLDFEMKQVMRVRRLEGLRSVYKERGYDPAQSVIVCTPKTELPQMKVSPDGYELGYLVMKKLIERGEEITAIVGLNDMIAIGAMDAIIDSGMRVPEDYSVCGCDNISISRYKGISLTTVDSYAARQGREAIDFLVNKIEPHDMMFEMDDNPAGITRIEYFPKLIVRKTTGRRRNN